jgi:hypothetical protein
MNKLNKLLRGGKMLNKFKILGVVVLALAVFTAPGAQAASIDLLTAGPAFYAVLGLGTQVTLTSSSVTSVIPGFANVGVVNNDNPPPQSPLTMTSGSIAGTVFLQNGAAFPAGQDNFSVIPGGGVVVDVAKLEQADTDALARSAFYNQPATIPGITSITNATGTLNAADGLVNGALNIINLSAGGLILTQNLTIDGDANTAVVFNVPNNQPFSMAGAQILLSGGIRPENVLFNLLETDSAYGVANSTINGIVLAPNVLFSASGTVFGEVIGSDVTLHSSANVINPSVPVPPSVFLFGSGLLGLGFVGGRKWFRKG